MESKVAALKLLIDEAVSTGSGSDRVIVLANSTIAWIDPVAPGTDYPITARHHERRPEAVKKLVEMIGKELEWVQPSAWKMEYELHAGDELIATLRFRSLFGSFATAESADGCWTFKRVGFWQTRLTIRGCGSDTDIAMFKNNTWSGGGTLELPDGRKILATTNFWQTSLEFKTEAGATLIRFKTAGVVHLSAKVEIQPDAAGVPELLWIVMFGWYLVVMMHLDSAVTVAAIS